MRKWYFVAGVAIGYVLGAKAGRERYEQIADWSNRVTGNDRVQQVATSVREQANKAAAAAQDKIKDTRFGEIVKGFTGEDEGSKEEPWDSASVTTPARGDRGLR